MGFSYFTTRSGKKLVSLLAGSTATCIFLVNYIPHTFGLDRYRAFMHCYRNGQPISLSSKIIQQINEATNILNIDCSEKNIIKPFSAYGFDIFAAGSTKSSLGAIIGIPFNYEVENVDELKRCNVCYRGINVNWDSLPGKLLEDALVLTNDEQVFGFCKTLLQLQTHYVLMNALFPTVSFLMVYSIGRYINLSLNLLQRPLGMRVVLYSILSLFGLGSWSFMTDYNQVSYDAEIDKKLSSISPKLMKAGIGYYEKQLSKNKALREIGNDNSFTKKGNMNYFLRQKSLPLTVRKSFFEKEYEEYLKTH